MWQTSLSTTIYNTHPPLSGGLFKQREISHHPLCSHCCCSIATSCFSPSTSPASTCKLQRGGYKYLLITPILPVSSYGGVIKLEPRRQTLNLFYCCTNRLNVSCLTELHWTSYRHLLPAKNHKADLEVVVAQEVEGCPPRLVVRSPSSSLPKYPFYLTRYFEHLSG